MVMNELNKSHFGNKKCRMGLFICQIQVKHNHLVKITNSLKLLSIINTIMIEDLNLFYKFIATFLKISIKYFLFTKINKNYKFDLPKSKLGTILIRINILI
jgi:hypothetical protein